MRALTLRVCLESPRGPCYHGVSPYPAAPEWAGTLRHGARRVRLSLHTGGVVWYVDSTFICTSSRFPSIETSFTLNLACMAFLHKSTGAASFVTRRRSVGTASLEHLNRDVMSHAKHDASSVNKPSGNPAPCRIQCEPGLSDNDAAVQNLLFSAYFLPF